MTATNAPTPDELHARGFFGFAALDLDEFYWTNLLGGLLNLRDLEGRPLGEEVAVASVRTGVPMEMRACPYSGSRANQPVPMNVSSLRQFGAHWDEVRVLTEALRDCVTTAGDGAPLDLFRLWHITRLGVLLPGYLGRRVEHPLEDGKIPVDVAITYRMALGLHRVIHVRLLMTLATGMHEQLRVIDPALFYRFADTNQMFFGTQSVCAGPQAMIEEAYTLLCAPTRRDARVQHPLVDGGLVRYANAFFGLEIEKYLFAVRAAIIQRALGRRLRSTSSSAFVRESFAQFEAFCAPRTSTLAQEIAGADEHEQEGVLSGLVRLREQYEAERASLGAPSWSASFVSHARPTPDADAVACTAALLAEGSAASAAELAEVAEALVAYLLLERRFLAVFEHAMPHIDAARGASPTPRKLTHEDCIRAFGPRLAEYALDSFGVSLVATSTETRIARGERVVSL